jgi:hypothetical protein
MSVMKQTVTFTKTGVPCSEPSQDTLLTVEIGIAVQ